jgi:hypothetical protein
MIQLSTFSRRFKAHHCFRIGWLVLSIDAGLTIEVSRWDQVYIDAGIRKEETGQTSLEESQVERFG